MTESGFQPVGVAYGEPKAVKLIYKLTPARTLLEVAPRGGCCGAAWGTLFSSFRSRSTSKIEKERQESRRRAADS